MMAEEKLTPREEFEARFYKMTDESWQWIKEYTHRQLVEPLMTENERAAVDELGKIAGRLSQIMGNKVPEDMKEAVFHIHALQNMVLSQAARRAFPDDYRRLGEVPNWMQKATNQ